MSLGARATKGGAKSGKDKHAPEKTKGADKPQPKEKTKPQATTEQLRMAHMIDRKSEDASDVRRMVLELMEMTCRTEEEVCSALHDSDNDLEAACNLLLEDKRIQGEWQTSEKKKKKPPAAAGNGEVDPQPSAREPRERSGPRPRRGEGEGGRGPMRGGARARGGGRGARGAGRGGRRGGRGGREPRSHPDWSDTNHAADAGGNMGDSFPATEDWDNEEWSGSLSDTKVFTPSTNTQSQPGDAEPAPVQAPATEDWDAPATNGPAAEGHIPTYTYHNAHHSIIDQINSANNHTAAAVAAVASAAQPPSAKEQIDAYHSHHHQPMGMSGSLSAAQSQYLSQLTAQSQRHEPAVYQYPVYQDGGRKQRARLPPPSKIPSMAVEMPGGPEPSSAQFLDVQFGALSPDTLDHDHHANYTDELSSPLPAAEPAPPAPAPPADTPASSECASLEKQLSAAMKQLSASGAHADAQAAAKHKPVRPTQPKPVVPQTQPTQPPAQPTSQQQQQQPQQQQQQQPQQQQQQQSQQNVYHHPVSHHPPVYQPNVYAAQVNSTNASLTGASAMSTYPSSVTLTQYQPMINSYQQAGVTVCGAQTTGAANVAGAYSALYTTGTAYYQPPPHKLPPTTQYESSVAASNSLTSTSTTQTSTAKVATTSAHVSVTASGTTNVGMGNAGYAATALYGAGGAAAYAYDDQLIQRTTTLPHHMTGYYEVGYGVGGVGAARDTTFGLGAGERFGRTDAASPQQVPAALPPGYAYFYQPPPSTYQYGVYPYTGSGVSAPAKTSYTQQYDQQDSYKPGGPYSGGASKTAAGNSADLSNAMYKTHVALNKVNSYEKATFHSGTPPPFGAGSHLYIPAPPHHHHHHQMDARVNSSHNRRESGAASARSAAAKPPASKPAYSQSYWAPN